MRIELTRAAGERELLAPDLVGEWADTLADLCTVNVQGPWGVYIAKADSEAVGVGLFKAPPDEDGWVEIAYLTFIPRRGCGIATDIARELVRLAMQEGASGIRAHTLPERGRSTAVLEENGFKCRGIAVDPDDGEVWRWERLARDIAS